MAAVGYYRPSLINNVSTYTQQQLEAFLRNIAVHLNNIHKAAREYKTHIIDGTKEAVTYENIRNGVFAAKDGILSILHYLKDDLFNKTLLPDMFDLFVGIWVNQVIKSTKILYADMKASYVYHKWRHNVKHIKGAGNTPVIVSVGLNPLVKSNGKAQKMNGDLKSIIDSNQKNGGILLLNSEGAYNTCLDAKRQFKGTVCISSNNGAFVSVMNHNGEQIVLQDKKLPSDVAKSLTDYFSDPNHNELNGFVMLLEGKDRTVSAIDLGNGKVTAINNTNFTTNPVDIAEAIKNSYNIRIVPKMTKYERKSLSDSKTSYLANNSKFADIYNQKAGQIATALANLPDDLKDLIDDNTRIQFCHDGSVSIVPKGCSKVKSMQLIADAYGMDRSQVMNMASSISDVCEPVTLTKISSYLEYGGNPDKLALNVNKIDEFLVNNPDSFSIISNFTRSSDMFNLINKLKKDAEVDPAYVEIEMARYEAELIDRLRTQVAYWESEKAKYPDTDTSPEAEAHRAKCNSQITNIINKKDQMLAQKRAELSTAFDISKYIDTHSNLTSRKVVNLSNKEITPAPTPTPTPSPSPSPSPTPAPTRTF